VPARNTPRRGARSRKRRARSQQARKDAPAAVSAGTTGDAVPAADAVAGGGRAAAPAGARATRARGERAHARRPRGHRESALYSPRGVGERPQAPWHPLPLSELLILVGAIGAAIGFSRGVSHGAAPMFAGLAAVLLGTLEFTLREHLSGYRSHSTIIAVIAVAAFHTTVGLSVAAFTRVPRALNVGLIAVDLALFAVLFKFLRARFLDARRERVFAGGR
jgi:hypothetical protein